jgi:hypothetical protein
VCYEITWQHHGVLRRYFGEVTAAEISQSVARTQGDRRFDDLKYVISDFRDTTGLAISASQIEEIVAIENAGSLTNRKIRIAMVATGPDSFAMALDYSRSSMVVFPVRVFASLDDAHAWLGLPAAEAAAS